MCFQQCARPLCSRTLDSHFHLNASCGASHTCAVVHVTCARSCTTLSHYTYSMYVYISEDSNMLLSPAVMTHVSLVPGVADVLSVACSKGLRLASLALCVCVFVCVCMCVCVCVWVCVGKCVCASVSVRSAG